MTSMSSFATPTQHPARSLTSQSLHGARVCYDENDERDDEEEEEGDYGVDLDRGGRAPRKYSLLLFAKLLSIEEVAWETFWHLGAEISQPS